MIKLDNSLGTRRLFLAGGNRLETMALPSYVIELLVSIYVAINTRSLMAVLEGGVSPDPPSGQTHLSFYDTPPPAEKKTQ
jgi:hypothetical protein